MNPKKDPSLIGGSFFIPFAFYPLSYYIVAMIREEFITASELALERLLAPIKDLPIELMDEPLTEGKWSVKQLILHLTYWNTLTVRALEALYAGEEFDWSPYDDIDKLNEQIVSDRQPDPYRRIVAEFQIVHGTLMAAVERIPAERFSESGELPDWLVTHVPQHYLHHAPKLEAWAKKIRDSGRGGSTGLPVVQ